MTHLFIAGASRGIGLALAREAAARGWRVTGTARGDAPELAATGARVLPLDMADAAAIDALPALLDAPIGIALMNAGVLGPDHQDAARATPEELGRLMTVNAAAPIRLARALLPLVAEDGVVAFTSSRMGSVAEATGALELYRASKAALNMLTRVFAAQDAGRRTVLTLHPGWVRTAMGGPQAPVAPEDSARGLADVLGARRGPGHWYLDHTGAAIPW